MGIINGWPQELRWRGTRESGNKPVVWRRWVGCWYMEYQSMCHSFETWESAVEAALKVRAK